MGARCRRADADSRARLLKEMLAAASAYPRLTDHADDGWHLHYRESTQSLSQVLAALSRCAPSCT
jgi:hypothetical protein